MKSTGFYLCISCGIQMFYTCFLGSASAVEGKLGKNRTEADMRRYIDERDCLEKEREEVRSSLANLKKERREMKEELSSCQGTSLSLPVPITHRSARLTAVCCPKIPSNRPH